MTILKKSVHASSLPKRGVDSIQRNHQVGRISSRRNQETTVPSEHQAGALGEGSKWAGMSEQARIIQYKSAFNKSAWLVTRYVISLNLL